MKTPEEKAKEYAEKHKRHPKHFFSVEFLEKAFLAGYNSAFEWIDVNEELPEPTDENLEKDFLVKGYFCRDDKKGTESYFITKINKQAFFFKKIIRFDERTDFTTTHWRSIEIKN